MEHVKKIHVAIQLQGEEIELGELISEGRSIYFKYYTSFIKRGLEISPIKLRLNDGLNQANPIPFDGLFGLFADSLPDGWGALLLDRTLAANGIDASSLTPLDRLAYVGTKGMGALVYKPERTTPNSDALNFDLDEMAKASRQIIGGTETSDVLEELYQLGGSSGGARPKILVGYNPRTRHLVSHEEILPAGYAHWLIKFSSMYDSRDMAQVEYAYYKMALDAGIEMSESRLFKTKAGAVYFGTKRFDRVGNERLHLHSAAGMMHDNFRLSNLDYGHLMDCAFTLERDVRSFEKVLRVAAFNVFAHNRDDHSKNFSFLMDARGRWKFAPAYDLTFSHASHGMHSTLVAGEGVKPNTKHLLELANYFKIKNAATIIDQVRGVVQRWSSYADACGVSKQTKHKIAKTIGGLGV
ncbi:MAG: type II toxin-antitoxin system HipA family toxin [Bacteroidia bacterium]